MNPDTEMDAESDDPVQSNGNHAASEPMSETQRTENELDELENSIRIQERRFSETQTRINGLTANHDEEPGEEAQRLITARERIQNELNVLIQALKNRNAVRAELRKRADAEKSSLIAQQKIMEGFMKHCPEDCKYKEGVDELAFIDKFVEWITATVQPRELHAYMVPVLDRCMKDALRRVAFINSVKDNPLARTKPKVLKEEFLTYHLGNSWQGLQWAELSTIAMGKEKPSNYLARLTAICRANGVDFDLKGNETNGAMIYSWFNRLPFEVQNNLRAPIIKIMEKGSIQDYMNIIKDRVPQAPTKVQCPKISCPFCPKKILYSCDCVTGRSFSKKEFPGKEKMFGKRRADDEISMGHKTRKTENGGPEQEAKPKFKVGQCNNCHGPWDKGCVSKCPGYLKRQNQRSTTAAIVIDSLEEQEIDFEALLEVTGTLAVAEQGANQTPRPKCVLTLNTSRVCWTYPNSSISAVTSPTYHHRCIDVTLRTRQPLQPSAP